MGIDKLANFAISVVLAAAVMGNVEQLTDWVHLATAKLLYESRTSTWGSPYFFKEKNVSRKLRSKRQGNF